MLLFYFLQTSIPLSSCGSCLAMSLSSSSISCLWAFTMSSLRGCVFLTAWGHLPSGTTWNMFFPRGTVGGYKLPEDAFPTSQLESVARPASFWPSPLQESPPWLPAPAGSLRQSVPTAAAQESQRTWFHGRQVSRSDDAFSLTMFPCGIPLSFSASRNPSTFSLLPNQPCFVLFF